MIALVAVGQARAELNPGIVVEEVAPNYEAAKAGLQAGDVLLRWNYGDASGQFHSQFDFFQVFVEQGPLGNVKFEGLHGKDQQVWTLGATAWGSWGVKVRPVLPENILSRYLEGQELAKAGKPVEAAQGWREDAGIAKESKLPEYSSWLLLRAAQSFDLAQHWQEADSSYQAALQEAVGSPPTHAVVILLAWVGSYVQRSDWDSAERRLQQTLAESQKLGVPNLVSAAVLYNLGRLVHSRGDLTKAEEYHRQSLAIREQLAPDSLAVAGSLGFLGNLADNRGDLQKAEEYYRQSLAIAQRLAPGSLGVASSLNNLANLAQDRGDLVKAEEYQRQALEIFEKLTPGSRDHAGLLNNLGLVVKDRGDLARAEEYQRQALEIREKIAPGSLDVAMSFSNLGNVVSSEGDFAKAEGYLNQALVIEQKLAPDSLDVAATLSGLGDVVWERGEKVKAEEYRRRALEIQEKLAPSSLPEAVYLSALGATVRSRNDLEAAERYYRQALAIREKLAPRSTAHAETLAALASIERERGRLDNAAQLYEQALEALEGQTARLGGSEEIRANFRSKHAGYYRDYADVLLAQKQPERAFEVLERSRARALLETLAAAHVDIRQGVDASLVEQERSLQQLLSAKSDRRLRLLDDKHTDEQLAAIDKEIQDLLAQYRDIEDHIRTVSPNYAALTQPQPSSAKEVQQGLLDPDSLLLEYLLGEERSYVFAVTANSLDVYELPKRADVETVARRLYKLLTTPTHGDSQPPGKMELSASTNLRNTAAALSQMVLGPVAAQIERKRLLVVCDGALQYVPFAVLPVPQLRKTGTTGARSVTQPVPLVAEHEIVNLPSASVLAVLRREASGRKQAAKQIAVLADPVFDKQDERIKGGGSLEKTTLAMSGVNDKNPGATTGGRLTRSLTDLGLQRSTGVYLPRLLYTRREAQAILAVTPPGQAMEALDFDASRATALSPDLAQYRIVHFATHGLLNSEHPELSGLVFSMVDRQGNQQNGFLDLTDIYNLNLSANLVVLSACQTALGKEIQGEGLLGLTRGFMYAGASRVLATLWNADDVATAELMGRFYKGIEQDGMRPAAALRQAQIQMWKQKRWADAYYWAGFQLQGEWK